MAGKAPQKPSGKKAPSAEPDTSGVIWPETPTSLPPVPLIAPLLARRLSARVLEAETAVRAPGQPAPLPTVYVSDTLLVRDVEHPSLAAQGLASRVDELARLAAGLDDPFVVKAVGKPVGRPARGEVARVLGPDARITVTRVRLSSVPDRATKSPDAWRFLQTALTEPSERGSFLYDKLGLGRLPDPPDGEEVPQAEKHRRKRRDDRGRSMASGVSVEHVLTAGGGVWGGGGGVWGGGGGVWGGGGGVWGGGGLAEYGTPGIGGRTPVVWSSPDPRCAVRRPRNAPVVAVLDTGLGRHPWFPDEKRNARAEDCTDPASCPGAHRRVTFGRHLIGVRREPSRDPENTGVVIGVNGLIDMLCGHGTFIAGIIRQRCPEAVILSVPVMASDGAALEDDVISALSQLLERHRAARKAPGTIPHGVLDVVNISLGYYHETPEDADDTVLHDLLQEFADEGIVVVACAGNDATRARFFPAAFAVQDRESLIGVGATNPDDHSVTLFTNVGDWVTVHAPGAGIVSTVPVTLSGAMNPSIRVFGVGPGVRAGVDPDDFRSGFAVWSGTSFASPWIAGEISRKIVDAGSPAHAPSSARSMAPSRSRLAAVDVITEANESRFEAKGKAR